MLRDLRVRSLKIRSRFDIINARFEAENFLEYGFC